MNQNIIEKPKETEMLTKEQAVMLCDAHEVYSMLEDEEEIELLEANNPELLEAYYALHRLSVGAETVTNGGDGHDA